ncbi:ATP-dependent 6-phosphofructokinase [candidate division KSB1 bacterium]|nr:MAG: ATP-dependent 6-phosphofructokinase [candidate division KSB1 bacterium]
MFEKLSFQVPTLGKCTVPSPVKLSTISGQGKATYTRDDTRVNYKIERTPGEPESKITFEKAGPREFIYFNPQDVTAAILTAGGLCPGLNDVIRSIFLELHFGYNVKNILGIRYGYKGLNPANKYEPVKLTIEKVEHIHELGGTMLGSSRGAEDKEVMVDYLVKLGVNILFCIGGDGTLRGAHSFYEIIKKRNLKIGIVAIPKTIDNDINFVYKTFGFETAVSAARDIINSAHTEALGAPNGIGLVKLMGRDSGFIAAYATLANQNVNFTLIPEVPFELYGKRSFLKALERRLNERGHAVIVIAEGAGQELISGGKKEYDDSGNIKLKDIGTFLKNEINRYFNKKGIKINLKYIDPSYIIRSIPANANDSIFCANLGRWAVHAGMAGKTDLVIGLWHGVFTHVPIPACVYERKKVSPESALWLSVLEATGQEYYYKEK